MADPARFTDIMATNPHPRTADDVLDLPLADGVRGYEFIDGQPVPVMTASGTLTLGLKLSPE